MKVSRRQRLRQYINKQRAVAKQRPLLTRDQERTLLARAVEGDVWASQLMVLHNLRYVLWVAGHYTRFLRTEDEFDDLVQEGCLGLAEAVRDYVKMNDASFIGYAKYHVKKNIFCILRQRHQVIHVPDDVHQALRKRAKGEKVAVAAFRMRKGRRALRTQRHDLYYFDRFPTGDHTAEANFTALILQERGERLYDALAKMQPRQAAVLVLRFALGGGSALTLAQTGKAIGRTAERVRSIERAAIYKLETTLRWMRGGLRFFND